MSFFFCLELLQTFPYLFPGLASRVFSFCNDGFWPRRLWRLIGPGTSLLLASSLCAQIVCHESCKKIQWRTFALPIRLKTTAAVSCFGLTHLIKSQDGGHLKTNEYHTWRMASYFYQRVSSGQFAMKGVTAEQSSRLIALRSSAVERWTGQLRMACSCDL